MNHSELLDDEHTKCLYSPSVPINFPPLQKPLPSVLHKRYYQAPLRLYSKLFQRKSGKDEKTSSDQISKRSSIALSARNHVEAKKRFSGIRKMVTTHETKKTLPSSRICIDVKQFVLVPVSV